jgi:hypothetical protein
MATISNVCKNCGDIFDWNDRWPAGLKRCPLCGMTDNADGNSPASGGADDLLKLLPAHGGSEL